MRIRKNSRLITSSSSSSSSPSLLICQLNRSPWDVSPQREWNDDAFARNGGYAESIPTSDSIRSLEFVELSFEYVEKPLPSPSPSPAKRGRECAVEDEIEAITAPFYSRLDLKAKPQLECKPPAAPLNATIPPAPKRRGRPRKPTTAAAAVETVATAANNNSYEFYYYSGFGPQWGKKRGGDKAGNNVTSRVNDNGNFDVSNGAETPVSSSITSHHNVMSEDDNGDYDMNINGKKNGGVVVDNVVDEELDYIDDDDDDDDDDNAHMYGGRRRARKPIKARSLKSLM